MMQDAPENDTMPTPKNPETNIKARKPRNRRRPKPDYQHWLFEPYNPVKGESALWAAVITQALMDALSNSRNPEAVYHKHEAIRWLTENNKDFSMVCHLAGFDVNYIRRKAKRAISNPVKWRADAGKGIRYEERKTYRRKMKERKQAQTSSLLPENPVILSGFFE